MTEIISSFKELRAYQEAGVGGQGAVVGSRGRSKERKVNE